jgi:hypothetical protein
LIYTAAGMVREAIKAFPAQCVSIRIGSDSTLTGERQSLAITRSSFIVVSLMSSQAHVWRLTCATVDLSAFDRLPAAFRLGMNGAFP